VVALVRVTHRDAMASRTARKKHAIVPDVAGRSSLALCGRRFVMGVPVERFGQIADIGDSRNPLPPLSGAGREVRCRLLALLTGPPVRWSARLPHHHRA